MQRRHEMPFGTVLQADDNTRFRLWAPGARTVDVCLEKGGREQTLPMQSQPLGWYELNTHAPAGSRYRFRIDGDLKVPDPASRYNPDDVHGPSIVINPEAFQWTDGAWRGRPWEEAVIYELHVGSFSPQGGYLGIIKKLDYLLELGISAIELMPLADFPGRRNWGYDGVLPFAPDASYGTPDELKRLINAAHQKGLMVFLDVVYNHFGPDGNYLHCYAPQFFTERHHTPWGAAINFDAEGSAVVREFFIHNALYWLEEFHFDGLRLDAVHAIADDRRPDIIQELCERVQRGPGSARAVHLMLENVNNQAFYLRPNGEATAQWNDDIHHALHVLLTGESDGYYMDYAQQPIRHLGRCLAEGFAYQGEVSPFRGRVRGERSVDLPAGACVGFLQNHDQIGNRAFGERIAQLAPEPALRAALAILLLAPTPPLLFMGEEFAAHAPFPFFCDFKGDLAQAVTQGRRNEFARFGVFADAAQRARIPDPNAESTWQSARLDWNNLERAVHRNWLTFYRDLLRLRRQRMLPLTRQLVTGAAGYRLLAERALEVRWPLHDGTSLVLRANLGANRVDAGPLADAQVIYQNMEPRGAGLAPWSVVWSQQRSTAA